MSARETIVVLAGSSWDAVVGTDRQLATQLAKHCDVLWVDPPVSILALARRPLGSSARSSFGLSQVGEGIRRLRVLAPPGVSRRFVRSITNGWLGVRLHLVTRSLGSRIRATVLASPERRFPRLAGSTVLYVTDDWSAGATLMGLDPRRVDRLLSRNRSDASLVCAVSPDLLDGQRQGGAVGQAFLLLPNGCDPNLSGALSQLPEDVPTGPFALLVGQLNERIDCDLLRAVADHDINVVIVGPRTERDRDAGAALDALFLHPHVRWLGPRPQEQLAGYLKAAAVGLTPYADTEFNRGSFPLKTLEYLAAGLPVVSSDLPSVNWLDTDLIATARTPAEFAQQTQSLLRHQPNSDLVARRRAFARTHSWAARADTLLTALAHDQARELSSRSQVP